MLEVAGAAEIDLDSLQTLAIMLTGSIMPAHAQGKDGGRVARSVA